MRSSCPLVAGSLLWYYHFDREFRRTYRYRRIAARGTAKFAKAGLIIGIFLTPAAGRNLPAILSDWWQVAGNPDGTPYTTFS